MSFHKINTQQVKVTKIQQVTADVKQFTFTAIKQDRYPFGAGAHLTLHLPIGGSTVQRPYSLINNPLDDSNQYEIAVKRLPNSNGGSRYLHDVVREGDILKVSTPDNFFPLHLEAKHHVFYAAGIGITPFLSMMAYLNAIDQTFELHYVATSPEQCAFYEEIKKKYGEACTFYFGNRNEKRKLLQESLQNHLVGTHLYICGPTSFMDNLINDTRKLGYPNSTVHYEKFTAPTLKGTGPFNVTLTKQHKSLKVPQNKSLLEVLHENGVKVPYSCRMGICGTCEVKVKSGEVTHNDSFLTEEEEMTKMLCCVSRAKSKLVLDL